MGTDALEVDLGEQAVPLAGGDALAGDRERAPGVKTPVAGLLEMPRLKPLAYLEASWSCLGLEVTTES